MTIPPETIARESPEVKLETTSEERAEIAKWQGTNGPQVASLLRDIATLLAQLQIANTEIVRLSASREEIREQLEGEVARLKAELADAQWKEHLAKNRTISVIRETAAREATARAEERERLLRSIQVMREQYAPLEEGESVMLDTLQDQIERRARSAPWAKAPPDREVEELAAHLESWSEVAPGLLRSKMREAASRIRRLSPVTVGECEEMALRLTRGTGYVSGRVPLMREAAALLRRLSPKEAGR